MKALPVRLVPGSGYVPCDVNEATHLTLNIPGGTGLLTLPVILRGRREGTGCWTWNGDTEAPTLRPSVRTRRPGTGFLCHSWISDGAAQFLEDCSHLLRGLTVPLLDVGGDEPDTDYCRPCGAFIGEGGMIGRAAPCLCVECADEGHLCVGCPTPEACGGEGMSFVARAPEPDGTRLIGYGRWGSPKCLRVADSPGTPAATEGSYR